MKRVGIKLFPENLKGEDNDKWGEGLIFKITTEGGGVGALTRYWIITHKHNLELFALSYFIYK